MFEELDRHARMLEGTNVVNRHERKKDDRTLHVNHFQDEDDNSGEFSWYLKVSDLINMSPEQRRHLAAKTRSHDEEVGEIESEDSRNGEYQREEEDGNSQGELADSAPLETAPIDQVKTSTVIRRTIVMAHCGAGVNCDILNGKFKNGNRNEGCTLV